jgi:hypothetical protein
MNRRFGERLPGTGNMKKKASKSFDAFFVS